MRNELYIGKGYFNRRERIEGLNAGSSLSRNKKSRLRWKAESEWIAQPVPAIISAELFQAAHTKLKENSLHCCGRPPKTLYLLRSILRCGVCGRGYVGTSAFGDKYYRCMNKERMAQPRCAEPSIAAKVIEPLVWNYVTTLLADSQLLESKLAVREDDAANQAEANRLQKQVEDVQRKESRLLEALLEGDIPLPGMRAKAKELEETRKRIEAAHREVVGRIELVRSRAQVKETVQRYCEALRERLPTLDMPARQKLLRALLDEVLVSGTEVTLWDFAGLFAGWKPSTTSERCEIRRLLLPTRFAML